MRAGRRRLAAPGRVLLGAAGLGLLSLPFAGPALAAGVAGVAAAFAGVAAGVRRLRPGAAALAARLQLRGPPAGLAGTVAAIALLAAPLLLNNYLVEVLSVAWIYVVLALGLNVVVGMAGLLNLGHVGFYAVGAYTYALLAAHGGVSFWIALPVGGGVAAFFGVLLGIPTLRLRGDYLAIVTLGFGEVVRIVLNNWDGLTGGPNGILGIPRPRLGGLTLRSPDQIYYLTLLLAVLAALFSARLANSRLGRRLVAIREDEVAAEAMGIPTTFSKIVAFALSAFWAGMAGVVFASKQGFISPESFNFMESVLVLCMVVLGGMGSVPGVILGAVVLYVLPEALRQFHEYRMLFFGAALVGMMIFRPEGIIPEPRRKLEWEGPEA